MRDAIAARIVTLPDQLRPSLIWGDPNHRRQGAVVLSRGFGIVLRLRDSTVNGTLIEFAGLDQDEVSTSSCWAARVSTVTSTTKWNAPATVAA